MNKAFKRNKLTNRLCTTSGRLFNKRMGLFLTGYKAASK